MTRHLAVCCIVLAALTLSGSFGGTQTRTIKVVVPYAAGGAPDITARLLGEEIAKSQGVTMVIENRPGAGAIIGTEAVMRAAPDGNTLMMMANAFLINPHLRKVNYDALTSFEAICHLVSVPSFIVVQPGSPYRTLADLFSAARARPGEITLASPGPATTFHIALEMLKRAANVNITYVPYAATPPALNALIGGHVTSVFSDNASLSGQLKAGAVRPIVTTAPSRMENFPDVPTVAESGLKDLELDVWFGLMTPAKTPKATVAELIGWYKAALQADAVKPRLAAHGMTAVGRCGADFTDFLRINYDNMGRIIREAGIKVE
jgi:tripartite-type tricarboxylate transporter receptor subunit TctC